jgi:hypothetical protein
MEKKDPNLKDLEKSLRAKLGAAAGPVVIDYDRPLVQRAIEIIGVRDGQYSRPLEDTEIAQACKKIEDRVVICGVYCDPQLAEKEVGRAFKELVGL